MPSSGLLWNGSEQIGTDPKKNTQNLPETGSSHNFVNSPPIVWKENLLHPVAFHFLMVKPPCLIVKSLFLINVWWLNHHKTGSSVWFQNPLSFSMSFDSPAILNLISTRLSRRSNRISGARRSNGFPRPSSPARWRAQFAAPARAPSCWLRPGEWGTPSTCRGSRPKDTAAVGWDLGFGRGFPGGFLGRDTDGPIFRPS